MARAAIAKAHQVEDAPDPSADALVRHTLHRIAREGRHRGRAAPLSWVAAEAAASIAAATGTLAGLRDAALIRVGSDALLRVSELAALQVADIETHPDDGSGMLTVRSSKTDQEGRGELRYLGTPTVAAVTKWLQAAGTAVKRARRPVTAPRSLFGVPPLHPKRPPRPDLTPWRRCRMGFRAGRAPADNRLHEASTDPCGARDCGLRLDADPWHRGRGGVWPPGGRVGGHRSRAGVQYRRPGGAGAVIGIR